MSRKTLLTEAEVRQFLKLANIGPVGDAKVQEMYHAKRDDEEVEEGRRATSAMMKRWMKVECMPSRLECVMMRTKILPESVVV